MIRLKSISCLILIAYNWTLSVTPQQIQIQKCQLDSSNSCHFPRLRTTADNPHFHPIADNIVVIKSVSFKQSFVPIITEDVFNAFPNLHTFSAETTSCKRIENGAFKNAGNLDVIRLSENNFTELPANIFNGADNITSVSFKYNQIAKIDKNAFGNLLELESLDLGHNLMVTIPSKTFHNNRKLKVLYINANLLEFIEPGVFENLTELRWLSLSVNRLQAFSVTQLTNSLHLEIVWLYSNYLTTLNAEFMLKNFKKLTKVHINDNYFKCDRLQDILSILKMAHVNETMNPYSIPRERGYVTKKISFGENSLVDCLTEEQYLEVALTPFKEHLLFNFIFGIVTIVLFIISVNVIGCMVVRQRLRILDNIIYNMSNELNYLKKNSRFVSGNDKSFLKLGDKPNIIYAEQSSDLCDNDLDLERNHEQPIYDKVFDALTCASIKNNVSIRDISSEGEEGSGPVILTVETTSYSHENPINRGKPFTWEIKS